MKIKRESYINHTTNSSLICVILDPYSNLFEWNYISIKLNIFFSMYYTYYPFIYCIFELIWYNVCIKFYFLLFYWFVFYKSDLLYIYYIIFNVILYDKWRYIPFWYNIFWILLKHLYFSLYPDYLPFFFYFLIVLIYLTGLAKIYWCFGDYFKKSTAFNLYFKSKFYLRWF